MPSSNRSDQSNCANDIPGRVLVVCPTTPCKILGIMPLIRALHTTIPGVNITVVGEDVTVELLKNNPLLTSVESFPGGRLQWAGEFLLGRKLKGMKFDLVIDLPATPRTRRLTARVSAPRRLGPAVVADTNAYTMYADGDNNAKGWEDYIARVVQQLGLGQVEGSPKIFLTETEQREARIFLQWLDYENGPIEPERPLVAFHPGDVQRDFPLSVHAGEFINILAAKTRAAVLLLTDAGTSPILDEVFASVKLLPRLPPRQLAAVLSRCTVCVSANAETACIAAAVETPTVVHTSNGGWDAVAPPHQLSSSPLVEEALRILAAMSARES